MKVYRCILPALFVVMAGWQLCAASLCGVHSVQIGYDTLIAHRGEPVTAALVRYTDAVAKAPRRRGVMSPARDMTEDDFKTLRPSADNTRKRALLNGLNHVKAEVAK